MMSSSHNNSRAAIFASVAFHVVVLFILAGVKVGIDFTIPEFIEITFASGNDESFTLTPSIDARPIEQAIENLSEQLSEVVQLPTRKMQENEAPLLKIIDNSKQIPAEEILPMPTIGQKTIEPEKNDDRKLAQIPGAKEIAVPRDDRSLDQKVIPDQSEAAAITGESPYHIEGQAAKRAVIYRVIPEYPADLQKEAIIKISFTVVANGQIGDMIPIIKSDATLERITLDALRQWRFNPLPAYEPQQIDNGIITFRYLLK